jgi:hypothetical protein
VAREDLSRANALDAMTFSLASLMGPALSAIVAELAGGSAGVVVAVALICLALPSALTLPAAQERTRNQPTTAIAADLTAGFRAINQSSPLARATTSSVISCAAEGMLVACTPLLGQQDLGAADRGTLLLSGIAASALAANAVLARHSRLIRPDTVIWCSAFGIAVGLALAATGRPVLLIAAMLLIGASQGPQLTALFAIRHREAPGHLRGQIFTTGASLKITGFAVGAGIAGPIAIRSLSNALLAAAGLQVLAVVCTTWCSRARLLGHSPGK